jgi:3',5'-cyclic AMP phosphodiesterase CpdA
MSNISIVNLSAYTSPVIQENKKEDYIEYGVDNNYFQYLIDRYLYSATNNAIITGVTNMIYGKGIDALDSNRKPNEYAQMRSIIKGDCLKKVALERKMLGMGAMQVIKEKGKVKKIDHFPMNTLRAEKCNDKGEIEAWYYHPDWTKKKPSEKAKRIPAFGFGNGNEVEMYVVHPYVSGFHYYTPIDYSGALPYAKLEEEISDYLINDVQNGFSGTKVINFNNGVPTEEMRDKIKRDVLGKLTGSRGEKVIVAFNANAESKTTVEDIPLNDAPAHYEYLSTECFEKLIVGHRVTSPMLLGIRDTGGGLGNNADEIKTATLLMDNIVIKPYQLELINAIDEILAVNDISLKLYFKTIQPLEFVDVNGMDAETTEEETGIKMSSQSVADLLIEKGEELSDEWFLIDETEVDYDSEEELDAEIQALNNKGKKEQSLLSKVWNFATTGTARPTAKSEQDKNIDGVQFITRYVYSGNRTGEREFCNKMVNANKVYRKEDIVSMSSQQVNAGFGPKGAANYDIWLYKGGARCQHKWLRRTYASFETKIDPTNPNAKPLSIATAEKFGYRVRNDKEVSMKPADMDYKGYTKEYWDKMGFTN